MNLGGIYLPQLLQDQELQQIQSEQRVSLALQVYGEGRNAWVEGWNQLAGRFARLAYGLTDDPKSVSMSCLSHY